MRRRPVGQHLPLLHLLPDLDDRLLVEAGVLVETRELAQQVLTLIDADALGVHERDRAPLLGLDHHAAVVGDVLLQTRRHDGRFGHQERHRLTLHVGAHQRPVGIVVLQKGDQAGRDADHLLGADVDELDLVGAGAGEVPQEASRDAVLGDLGAVGRRVGRRQVGLRLLVGPQRLHVVLALPQLALLHLAVGGNQEAVLVHTGVDGQVGDQADVGPFGGLDGADAAVVRDVHVAHVEAGPLAVEAPRPQRRQPPLVRQLRQRIGLVHHLAQLAAAEEVLDGGGDGLGVDEGARGHVLLVADGHALLHGAAQLEEALAQLVGGQLVDGADAAVAEVVDVVDVALAVAQAHDVADGVEVVQGPQGHLGFVDVLVEFAVDAEAADLAEAVAVGVLEFLAEQLAGLLQLRGVARPEALVDLEEGLLVRVGRVLVEGGEDEGVLHLDEHGHFLDRGGEDDVELLLGEGLAAIEVDLARFRIDDVADGDAAQELGPIGGDDADVLGGVEGLDDVGVGGVGRVHGAQQRHG